MQGGENGPTRTGHRAVLTAQQVARKDAAVTQRLGEEAVIAGPGDLDPAELRQMRGQKLGVEQPVPAEPQARGEVDQRDLARIGDPAEHALAEKRRAERDAVQAADEIAVQPALDAVRRAAREQRVVEAQNLGVYPGVRA